MSIDKFKRYFYDVTMHSLVPDLSVTKTLVFPASAAIYLLKLEYWRLARSDYRIPGFLLTLS